MNNQPRGIRNHNPGNIKINENNAWQGRIPTSRNTDGTFEQFHEAAMGIRALAVLLINYYDKHSIYNIRDIIDRWAPGSENDTSSYIRAVSHRMGRDPSLELDLHLEGDIRPLVESIIWHENGQMPYTSAQITEGLSRAGIIVRRKDLKESRSMKGASVAGVAVAASASVSSVIEPVVKAQESLEPLLSSIPHVEYVLLLIALVGIGWTVYARWDDRRKGLR